MSDEKSETIEDIVREMRDYGFPYVQQNKLVENWCDRIEAAARRESEVGK